MSGHFEAKTCPECGEVFGRNGRRYAIFARIRFCSKVCGGKQEKKGGAAVRFARFWRLDPKTGCHLWHGATRARRYGAFYARGEYWAAHRFAYVEAHGSIPDGMVVMHTCDTPLCVNVAHLRLGTQTDNVADMVAKGRVAFGTRASKTKLTEEQVLEIRQSTATIKDLAAQYRMGRTTISSIRSRTNWKHLP